MVGYLVNSHLCKWFTTGEKSLSLPETYSLATTFTNFKLQLDGGWASAAKPGLATLWALDALQPLSGPSMLIEVGGFRYDPMV